MLLCCCCVWVVVYPVTKFLQFFTGFGGNMKNINGKTLPDDARITLRNKAVFKFKSDTPEHLLPIATDFLNDHRSFEVVKRELFVYKDDVKKLMPKGKAVRVTVELVDD